MNQVPPPSPPNDDMKLRRVIRVAIADREIGYRVGVRAALSSDRFEVVAEAGSLEELSETPHRADVLLVDEHLWLRRRLRELPYPSVAIIGRRPSVDVLRVAAAGGVYGYVDRATPSDRIPVIVEDLASVGSSIPPDLTRALLERLALPSRSNGRHTPTARQREVALLGGEGLTTKEIARSLGVSATTVRRHRSELRARGT